MTSRATLLLAFTLLGLAAASAATWVHAELVRHPDLSSVCDVSATVNCTDGLQQRLRQARRRAGGRPRACCSSAGCCCCRSSARVLRVPDPAHVGAYVFLLSLPGVAFAAYLAIASWFVLHVVCLLCVTIDVATLGVCVIGALMTRFPFASLPGRVARDLKGLLARPAAVALGAGFVAAALALLALFPRAAAEPVFASAGEVARVRGAAAGRGGPAAVVAGRRLHGHRDAAHDPGRRRRRRRSSWSSSTTTSARRAATPSRPTSRSRRSGTRKRRARSSS